MKCCKYNDHFLECKSMLLEILSELLMFLHNKLECFFRSSLILVGKARSPPIDWRPDSEQNDTQQNDTQHNNKTHSQHK